MKINGVPIDELELDNLLLPELPEIEPEDWEFPEESDHDESDEE